MISEKKEVSQSALWGSRGCDITLKPPQLDDKVYFHVKAANYGFIYRFIHRVTAKRLLLLARTTVFGLHACN